MSDSREICPQPAVLRTRPILIVEDNPMDLDLMMQAFVAARIANPAAICRDGEEALRYIKAHETASDPQLPLLVLLDLRLPNVDGVEVLRIARQNRVWNQVPFIALSISRESDDIQRTYELGVNSYIVKPVDFNSFTEVIKLIKLYWLQTNEPPFREIGHG